MTADKNLGRRRRALAMAMLSAALGPLACASPTDETTATSSAPPTPAIGTLVPTAEGDVQGAQDGELLAFLGIPYAAPPLGDLRLRPPAAPPAIVGVLDATEFGPFCPQLERPSGWSGPSGTSVIGQEDCLTLNVWAHPQGGPRPVMVFLHGGGFVAGGSAVPLWGGSSLALAGDTVVVSLNYRLGALGFLATEALAAESGEDSAGNYGLRDQIAALEWVAQNIAAFGGDPGAVTLFGESAGGYSVCALLGAARTQGLFARAVIESGGGCYGFPGLRGGTFTYPSGIDRGAEVLAEVGCAGAADELACLRALPFEELAKAGQSAESPSAAMSFVPLLDGALVQDDAYDLFEQGARDLPLIIGSNADEMSLFTESIVITTEQEHADAVAALIPLPSLVNEILALYPPSAFANPKAAYNAFLADLAFVCPALAMSSAAAGGPEPAYAYHFTHSIGGAYAGYGAFHSLELAFVFDSLAVFAVTPGAEDQALTQAMQTAWASFARGAGPALEPSWSATVPGAPSIALLDEPPSIASNLREGRCDGLRSLGLVR